MPSPQQERGAWMCRAPPRSRILGGLTAFLGADLARVAAGLAYGNLRELIALFLAVVAVHFDDLRKVAGMLRIDCCQRCERVASGDELIGGVGALGQPGVFHF